MVHAIEKKGLGIYLIQKGSALEKRRYEKKHPRYKTTVDQPLTKELVKLNYKVQKMERDDYEEEKIPDTDDEEELQLKDLWTEYVEAVAQGT